MNPMDDFITRAEHREFAERIDAENNRQNKRIDKLERDVSDITQLTLSVQKIANSVENMQKELCAQGQRLKDIEDKPKNEWDKLKWLIIGALVSGTIAFFLGRFLV